MSSAIECVCREFKEICNIEHAIIYKFTTPKEFKISIQCEEKNDVNEQRRKLFAICKKSGIQYISCSWDINFDVSEIISIKLLYDSTFLFIFSKKKIVLDLYN